MRKFLLMRIDCLSKQPDQSHELNIMNEQIWKHILETHHEQER
jgi:hypothetical protein